jgi:S1-C subfamily serine protease
VGSVGGEILRRFSVIFDFANESLYLKKNRTYFAPFVYNKSGIEIMHSGVQWVKETVRLQTFPVTVDYAGYNREKNISNFKYKFQLKPVFEIANVRKKSPAANSGLQKGDVIISINKNPSYNYTLQKINSFLRPEEEKWITLEIERNSQPLKFSFQLIDVL